MHSTTKFNFGRNKLFCDGWCRKRQKLGRRSWSDIPLDIINLIAGRFIMSIKYDSRLFARVGKQKISSDTEINAVVDGYNSHLCYLCDPSHKQKYPVFNSSRNRTIFVGATPLD